MRPRLHPLAAYLLAVMLPLAMAAAASAPVAPPADDVVRGGWAGDRALAARFAAEATAVTESEGRAAALPALRSAMALDPWHAKHALRLAALHLTRGEMLAAIAATQRAVFVGLSYPNRAHLGASLCAAALLAWSVALALAAVVQTSRLGKSLWHGIVHRLGRTPAPEPQNIWRLAPAVVMTLALVLLARVAGPLGAGAVAMILLAPCASRPERGALAPLLALTGLIVALVPLALGGYQQGTGDGELRFWATQDRSAAWARSELLARSPQASNAAAPEVALAPREAWARGLLALHDGAWAAADAHFATALTPFASEPALHIAAAEAAFGRGELERAAQQLAQALALKPHLVVANFNLSQVLLAQAKPTEAQQARNEAFARGGSALLSDVAALERTGRALLPPPQARALFVDEPALEDPQRAALVHDAIEELWQPLGGLLPRPWVGALCAIVALLLLVFARPLPRRGPVRPPQWPRLCGRCGAIACPHCAPSAAAAGHCAPCFGIDTGSDSDLSARMAQQRRTRTARARQGRRVRAGAWLWPGLGLLAVGEMRAGTLWAAVGALLISALVLEPYPAGFAPWSWLAPRATQPVALVAVCAAYLVALLLARRQAHAQLG